MAEAGGEDANRLLDAMFRDVINMLGRVVDPAILAEIATNLGLEDLDAIRNNVRALYHRIVTHINSEPFLQAEDGGLAYIMAARDRLRVALNITVGDPDEDVKHDLDDHHDDDPPFQDALPNHNGLENIHAVPVNAVNVGGIGRLRELKLSGSIGKPGQKGKLTYSSLLSQIRNAVRRGFDDSEICAAVIRCIDPNTALRNYLEEIEELTVDKMIPTLQSHFQEKNATALYHQMNNAVMTSEDTELSFCMDLMALRDKIFKISQTQGGEYTKPLLQAQFQKALYTGIKNESVRQELKPYLSSKRKQVVSDQQLMAEITDICMLDLEHQAKVDPKSKQASVSSVIGNVVHSDDSSPQVKPKPPGQGKPPLRQRADAKPPRSDIVAQLDNLLTPLTTQVCELYGAVQNLTQAGQGTNSPQQRQNQSSVSLETSQIQQQSSQQQQPDDKNDPLAGGGEIGVNHWMPWGSGLGYGGNRGRGPPWPFWWPPVGRGVYDEYENDGYQAGADSGRRAGGFDNANRGGFNSSMGRGRGNDSRGGFHNSGGRGINNVLGSGGSFNPGGLSNQGNFSGRGGHNNWNNRGRGGFSGGRGSYGGNQNFGGPSVKCPSCTQANAVFCNHCKVCYAIDHRSRECPHRDDPNFVPPKN